MIRSLFASIVSAIFNFVFVATFFLFVFLNTILLPSFYENGFSEGVRDMVVTSLVEEFADNGMINDSSKDVVVDALHDSLKPEYFSEVLVPVVEQIIAPVRGNKDYREIVIDLSPLKDNAALVAEAFSDSVYEALPKCGDENVSARNCLPETVSKADYKKEFAGEFGDDLFRGDLTYTFEMPLQRDPVFEDVVLSRSFVWKIVGILGGISLFLLGLIALIIFKPWHKVLRWVGGVLLTGTVSSFVLFFVLDSVDSLVPVDELVKGGDLPVAQVQNIVDTFGKIFHVVAVDAYVYALVMFIISLALLVVSIVGKRNHKNARFS